MGRGIAGFRGMAGIVDTHTHLESFVRAGRLEETLGAAREAGVERLVTVGTGSDDWELYAELAAERAEVDYTVGMHPCSVEDGWEAAATSIEGFWNREKAPAALGEIGLDRFHLPKDSALAERAFARQLAAFEAQLGLARRMRCPVVIHSRGAFADCVDTIDRSGVDWAKVVFHCFAEGPGEMKALLDRGGFGSFTGIITFKNAESVREAARLQGLERLMVETDAPYLAPMPHRGKPNEPAYVVHTAAYCAKLFGVGLEELAERTSANAAAFYGWARGGA